MDFSFMHFLTPERIIAKATDESYLLPVILLLIAAECALSGRTRSSIGRWSRFSRTDAWDLFSFALQISFLRKALAFVFSFGLLAYLSARLRDVSLVSEAHWIVFPIGVLLQDFLMYWAHRWNHESPWLWNVHELHHSATRVTVFTQYRVHPLDYFVFFPLVILPTQILLGTSFNDSIFFGLLSSAYSLFTHSRIDTDLGWLGRYVLVSPRFHHSHHGLGNRMMSNYGIVFCFWDRLFGTYREPVSSLNRIQQGLEENFYETESPAMAYLRPVMRFYLWPFSRARQRRRA